MSNFVHCMVCFVFPVPGLRFYLSGCGHIACLKCVQKGAMTLKCKVCQKDNPQTLEINRNLKPEFRELFTPTLDFFAVVRDIGYASDFQNGHRMRLLRHLRSQSNNLEKLQHFCKEEMRKKEAYKQDLHRIKIEYKKKCEEANNLKDKIVQMKNCSINLNDLTHDPFRTPGPSRTSGQRSFTTSTPYKHPRYPHEDFTHSTVTAPNQTDSSVSFASVGIPSISVDPNGEVSNLARLASAMCRDKRLPDSPTRNDCKSTDKQQPDLVIRIAERIFPPQKNRRSVTNVNET